MPSPLDVTDIRSNAPEQIVHAAKVLGHSKQRMAIFEAICRGKRKIKTLKELIPVLPGKNKSPEIRILQLGGDLVTDKLVKPVKDLKSGRMAYKKDPFYSKHYKKILSLASNPQKLKTIPTKRNPAFNKVIAVKINIPRPIRYHQITIDDIDSFRLVKIVPISKKKLKSNLTEKKIKQAFKKIIGESGTFKDWGGERSDLFTTKLKLRGKRVPTAIAFKGKSTTGKLTPEKMGERGTQVERLFQEPANLFLIVYQGQIDPSVIVQMQVFALAKSTLGQEIYFGVVDQDDFNRLLLAYEKFFK